jgi:hypothetical protein
MLFLNIFLSIITTKFWKSLRSSSYGSAQMRKRAILLCGRKDLCSYADFQVCAHVFQVALSSVHKRVSFGDCWRLLESSGIELTFPSLASQDRIDNRKCYIASQPFVFFQQKGLALFGVVVRCSCSLVGSAFEQFPGHPRNGSRSCFLWF